MAEVLLKIESEGREGVLAVGSYLIDAAGRLGVRIEEDPETDEGRHSCGVIVQEGIDLLSELTEIERSQFAKHGQRTNERLACQAKFVKPGEIVIMTDEKKKKDAKVESEEEAKDRFRKEFEEMPLETKIANLLRLEYIALGDTFNFIFNSPYKVFDKVMDVMAEFGLKKDEEAKKAQRPQEHQKESKTDSEDKKNGGHSHSAPAAS